MPKKKGTGEEEEKYAKKNVKKTNGAELKELPAKKSGIKKPIKKAPEPEYEEEDREQRPHIKLGPVQKLTGEEKAFKKPAAKKPLKSTPPKDEKEDGEMEDERRPVKKAPTKKKKAAKPEGDEKPVKKSPVKKITSDPEKATSAPKKVTSDSKVTSAPKKSNFDSREDWQEVRTKRISCW